MASTPPSDLPEFRGKTLSPVSPRPLHIPEPSSIPVLENQMDPTFNETSTHLDPPKPTDTALELTSGQDGLLPEASPYPFTYDEMGGNNSDAALANGVQGEGDLHDDYTMSLDLDDEETWDSTITASSQLAANDSSAIQPSATFAAMSTDYPSPSATVPYGLSLAATEQTSTEPISSSIYHDDATAPPTVPEAEAIDAASLSADAAQRHDQDSQNQAAEDENADPTDGGGVNIQALLDNLSHSIATARSPEGDAAAATDSSVVSIDVLQPGDEQSPSSGLPAHPNLPPRPPPQDQPGTQPGYAAQDDIRLYHPHSQTPVGASGFSAQPANAFHPAQGPTTGVVAAGAPGTASQPASNLLPPPIATFQQSSVGASQQQQSPTGTNKRHRDRTDGNFPKRGGSVPEEDDEIPWGPEIQKIYDEFLQDERVYVSEGQWDRFPPNSRLFIGNLPTEKVTKRDLFYIFQKHGRLAQVSIKQAYGFVQFLDAEACYRALQAEQGQSVRGRKMHLEISKPQKNTRNAGGDQRSAFARRSRSPDHKRGTASSPRAPGFVGGRGGDKVDRGVDNRSGRAGRDRGGFGDRRGRDDYRPARSPSPRGYRGPDDYRRARERSCDRYELGARRSRSRSPYRRNSRYHSRSPPPPRWGPEEEVEMLLPKRQPRDVPEVQFLILDELDRNFIAFVEKAFRDRAIRTDVLFMNPRLPLAVVIKRQILEGVQAVVRLTRQCQINVKIPLQVFDRSSGTENVRFDEYDGLEPHIAAELVLRAKQTKVAPPQTQFPVSMPGYPAPQPQYGAMFAPAPAVHPQAAIGGMNPPTAPNLTNLITSLDGPALQKLLGVLQQQSPTAPQPQPQHAQVPQLQHPTDLASLLGAGSATAAAARPSQPQQQQFLYHQQAHHPPQANPYAALTTNTAWAGNPALATLLASTAAAAAANRPAQGLGLQPQSQQHHQPLSAGQQQATPQVQNIMQQLAKWKQ